MLRPHGARPQLGQLGSPAKLETMPFPELSKCQHTPSQRQTPLGMPRFKNGTEGSLAALQLGFITSKTSQLHAIAACTAEAPLLCGKQLCNVL